VAHDTVSSDSQPVLVAIDGPAGAGKSTIAALLAARLGVPHIDTGAMYRAVALLALRDGLDLPLDDSAHERIEVLMASHALDMEADQGGTRILLDGEDVSTEIRSNECSMMASAVSALPAVRRALVPLQRRLGERNGGVMEGRDIGSVVLPDATLKVFLTANPEERARRRYRDLAEATASANLDEVRRQQRERDFQDTTRSDSPLQVARGSVVVDTSDLAPDEVVDRLLRELDLVLHNGA
jgi:cytidylate kinase